MLLQGSSYNLPICIKDKQKKVIIGADIVEEASFTIGEITKNYPQEVYFEDNAWIMPLTEEETFELKKGNVSWQARFLFKDGSTDGTLEKNEYVYGSVNKYRFTEA